jgi:hypothetical protein
MSHFASCVKLPALPRPPYLHALGIGANAACGRPTADSY